MKNPEKITSSNAHEGQPCILCGQKVAHNEEVVVCPRCHSVHHVDCWKNKGGCGKIGCSQIAQAVIGDKPQGDGPPPPMSKWTVLTLSVAVLSVVLLSIFWPKPPDPAEGRTKVVFFGEAYHELTQEMTLLADHFNNENNRIYIDLQLLPPGASEQKLVVLIAAGVAPDLITLNDERFTFFAEQGSLLALSETKDGNPIYGIQHPSQIRQLVIWRATPHPEETREVLDYFLANLTPADLEQLRELETQPTPFFGF